MQPLFENFPKKLFENNRKKHHKAGKKWQISYTLGEFYGTSNKFGCTPNC